MVGAADDAAATLHGPWAGQACWSILELAGEPGVERFIHAWQVWREDAERPRLLHYVLVAADPDALWRKIGDFSIHAGQQDLHRTLRDAGYGLTTGQHRLSFESGRVLLTLALGKLPNALRQLQMQADRLLWPAGKDEEEDEAGAVARLKSLLRLCRHGATVRIDQGVKQTISGGSVETLQRLYRRCGLAETGSPSDGAAFAELIYAPSWQLLLRSRPNPASTRADASRSCIVIGAGLAGAAAAASLARRGWSVRVLDAAASPAAGTSGLPVGLLVPHFSADDNLFSRLTRSGARTTWDFLHQSERAILRRGMDWNMSGVLEILFNTERRRREQDVAGMSVWDRRASDEQLRLAGLSASSPARWHARAGWIKPARLVELLLQQNRIEFRGASKVTTVRFTGEGWELLGPGGEPLAASAVVVVAASMESDGLLGGALGMQAVSGQISWGENGEAGSGLLAADSSMGADKVALPPPPFPVNGNGSFIAGVPGEDAETWYLGASYQRGAPASGPSEREHQENLKRLSAMLPETATRLAGEFHKGRVKSWCGVRATTPDRMPIVGRIESGPQAGIWLSTGMGSRGLSFSLLCGELLAAQMNGEPWPVDRRTGSAMSPGRFGA